MVQNLHINKDEFSEEVVNQLIQDNNITIKLTAKRKRLLAVLLFLNGLDNKDEQGRFFIDNLWLSNFVGMTETNLLVALRYFKSNGIIKRESGYNHNCSRYKIINKENNSINKENNSINKENNSINKENNSINKENNSINKENNSRDIDKELDIEKEKDIYNIINNIIKDNINNLINIIEEKENNIINIIKEKEKTSSIENNKKEKDTLMEETLQEQINQLKEQSNQLQEQNDSLKEQIKLLTSRLNSAAKQFKIMNNTMRALQLKESKTSTAFFGDAVEDVKELKKEETIPTVEGRKDKEEIKTINVEVKPSTAFCGDAVEAKKELSPIEEDINETFDVEEIVGYFKEAYTDPTVARQREIELLQEFKKAHLSYGNHRDLELRLNRYIKSLELINSTEQEVKEEVPTVAMEVKPIEEEVKETIPTVEVEIAQVPIQEELQELPQEAIKEAEEVIESRKEEEATEGKEITFVDSFQTNDSNSSISEERLRYQDIKTKLYYPTLEEAQAANVNPMFLYDNEVSRCVSSY